MNGDTYTGAELFVDALKQYGVTRVFGNPGTTELPIVTALSESDVQYTLGLHEDIAVGAATGYAVSRRYRSHHDQSVCPVGVVNLHIAPGLAHGLGNMYNALASNIPLVVTAGNNTTEYRHEEPALSGDLVDLAEPVTKWSAEVLHVNALPTMLRRAFRVALTPPAGPVFLSLPMDVTLAETTDEPEPLGPIPSVGAGDASQIERAADLLVEADEPVLIVGDGLAQAGRDAIDAAVRFAEVSGVRVHAEILAAEVDFPNDHDQWVSNLPAAEKPSRQLMDADTIVFVGCSSNTTITQHERPLVDSDTTCIHVTDDPWEIGKHNLTNAAVIGDPGDVLSRLAAEVDETLSEAETKRRRKRVRERKAAIQESDRDETDTLHDHGEGSISKTELAVALREVTDNPCVVDESLSSKYTMLAEWEFQPEQYFSNKGGGLGQGLPASVGVALDEQERPTDDSRSVIGYVGDGSYLYYPHALYTASRYDVDVTIVVPNNRNYRVLKDGTMRLFGGNEDEYEFGHVEFEPAVDIPANAESHGARGIQVTESDELVDSLRTAIEHDGPVVVSVRVHD